MSCSMKEYNIWWDDNYPKIKFTPLDKKIQPKVIYK